MKPYKIQARIESLNGREDEITVLKKVGKNEYIVSYKDLLCHATFDWDTFEYYAFDQGGN